MTRLPSLLAVIIASMLAAHASAADWPQYGCDAGRTAASAESLPATLHLAWTRQFAPPRPAFPTELRLAYDATYEPVVLGSTIFVPSMVTDSVTALDTQTGAARWQFFTEGPVRLAPVAWQGKVYFVSDDGYLYCVAAGDGKLLWKFRQPLNQKHVRKAMGNGRLVSLVPARGGPVLADGILYFAAGIWSGEGVFVHALDAATGRVVWSNLESHRIEKANMDHGIANYAGLSPQGHMAVVDDKLVIPCGAQLPAVLDLKTGEVESYTMGWGGRVGLPKGCSFVSGIGEYLIHGGDLYDIHRPNEEQFKNNRPGRVDFKPMLYPGGLTRLQIERNNQKALGQFRQPVLTPEAIYYQQDGLVAYDLTEPNVDERANSEVPAYRKNDLDADKMKATFPELWTMPSVSQVQIKAGRRLYCSRPGAVEAIDLPAAGEKPKITWQAEVDGTPHRLLAGDGKLFVVTREGSLYAFAGRPTAKPKTYSRPPALSTPKQGQWAKRAAQILEATGTADGYVVMFGIGTGRLARHLVLQSKCDVIAVEPDAGKVDAMRKQFHKAGLYGSRVTILLGDPASYPFPPYMASLIVSEDPASLLADASDQASVEKLFRPLRPYGGTACLAVPADGQIAAGDLPGAAVRKAAGLLLLTRAGELPQAANWSHEGANAANTGASEDLFVKPPLARLWYDSGFRWHRKPGVTLVRVAGGRVLVKSARLDAVDVYTGRHLWAADLPEAHGRPGDIVATEDAVYLSSGNACVVLDPATGKQTGRISLPPEVEGPWSMIRVDGDLIVGAAGKQLVCIDRQNGKLLWKQPRDQRIGSIAVGGSKVFSADLVARPRGGPKPDMSKIATAAFDARSGELLWQITGTADVRYNEPLDLLVTSGGILQAADGARVWNAGGSWPVTADKLLKGGAGGFLAHNLATGTELGDQLKWTTRGCTSLRAGSHMVTTRYLGNAAYVDLADGQITSIWNVRAACSNNLFPANGILNIPNLSGECTCNYMPISQAFVPVAVLE